VVSACHSDAFGYLLLERGELLWFVVAEEAHVDDQRSVHQEGWLHLLLLPVGVRELKAHTADLLSVGQGKLLVAVSGIISLGVDLTDNVVLSIVDLQTI